VCKVRNEKLWTQGPGILFDDLYSILTACKSKHNYVTVDGRDSSTIYINESDPGLTGRRDQNLDLGLIWLDICKKGI
jgi:hypothetical protein